MGTGLVVSFVFFIIIMFVTFIVIWRRLMSKRLDIATQHLDDISQDYIKKQDEAKKKLEEAEGLAQQTINQAKEEALTMRKDIIDSANSEKDKIIQEAKQQADEAIEQAEKTRHMLISELDKKISIESTKKSSQLLGAALSKDIRLKLHVYFTKNLLDAGLLDLKELDVPADIGQVKVVSAFALDSDQKKVLFKIIKDKTSKGIAIEEEIKEDLIAGFVIQFGHLVLDGSLQHKIQERSRESINKDNE
jgi:F0F1-type ATP synthase delta subunit